MSRNRNSQNGTFTDEMIQQVWQRTVSVRLGSHLEKNIMTNAELMFIIQIMEILTQNTDGRLITKSL